MLVYFSKGNDIKKIISEQVRVTSECSFIIVYNGENVRLRKTFEELKKTSSLYDIRFYSKKELINLVFSLNMSYKKINFYKFGGPANRIYSILRKLRLLKDFVIFSRLFCHFMFILYQITPLVYAERICICVSKK